MTYDDNYNSLCYKDRRGYPVSCNVLFFSIGYDNKSSYYVSMFTLCVGIDENDQISKISKQQKLSEFFLNQNNNYVRVLMISIRFKIIKLTINDNLGLCELCMAIS